MPASGDRVRIHYTGRLDDGTEFDSSRGGDPFEFEVGTGQVIPGVDESVQEMDEGETRTVRVDPAEAYGERQPGLTQRIDRSQLPEGVTEGSGLRASTGDQETILWVTELTEDSAVVDANHPLAGKTLTFDIELVSVHSG